MTCLLFGSNITPYDKRGTSLLEIMISLLILCVAAIGAASIFSHGHKETSHDFRRGEALQILVDRMNFLSSLPFKSLEDAIGTGGLSKDIHADFRDVKFGNVTIGHNTYDVAATLKKQSITFNNLMELDFPNKDYAYDKPNTWKFRSKKSDTYADLTGDYAYAVIKVTVNVTPINGKMAKQEKTYSAITFVCNTE